MQATLALVLALAASGQQPGNTNIESIPSPPGYPAAGAQGGGPYRGAPVVPPQIHNFPYPTGHSYPDIAPQGIYGPKRCEGWMYPNGICGHHSHCVDEPYTWLNWWLPPGNMLPAYGWFPAEHGYYNFEPYNVTRVGIQQKFVASYGGDPRHPYTLDVFHEVYKAYYRRHPQEPNEGLEDVPTYPEDVPEFDLESAFE